MSPADRLTDRQSQHDFAFEFPQEKNEWQGSHSTDKYKIAEYHGIILRVCPTSQSASRLLQFLYCRWSGTLL
jgi:hypothetical protein